MYYNTDMGAKSGLATMRLNYGKVPRWHFEKMRLMYTTDIRWRYEHSGYH